MKRAPKLAEVNTSEGVWAVLKKSNLLNFLFLLMPKDENICEQTCALENNLFVPDDVRNLSHNLMNTFSI